MTERAHTMRNHRGEAVTLPEERRREIVDYLKHQGAKTTEELAALIDRSQAILDDLLSGMTEEQAAFRPDPDQWSVKDVLAHIDASLHGTARIIEATARGERPSARSADPASVGSSDASLDELRDRVEEAYRRVRETVLDLGPDPDLSVTVRHPFFDELNCKEWAAFIYLHCGRDHTNQIQQIMAHPGFPR
ncbi:MAG TPA: DinB family protein [Dehalococcoidia bacterium]